MSHDPQQNRSLASRLWEYQGIRFPVAGFGPLVIAFTFSSAAYSRIARGSPGFISWTLFSVGAFTALVFFFMLRVLDEHKDREVDARFRPELPVPRGLVSLRELRLVGGTLVAITIVLNWLLAPTLLWTYAVVAVWAALMTAEFFVGDWLRAHPAAYLLSHMAIMPAIDLYTTGLDWVTDGAAPPTALAAFLAVTFANGILIEIGRKLRPPDGERDGVDTYSKVWGIQLATVLWLATLVASATCAWVASRAVGTSRLTLLILVPAALAAALPALRFLRLPAARSAVLTEKVSQVWPLLTYILLGIVPYANRWLTTPR
jgi:4-hydroxybenzoate polyprenyltransferase